MLQPNLEHTVLFTVDDLEKMIAAGIFAGRPGRIELIEGELQKMSPASERHDKLVRLLTSWSVKQQTEDQFEIGVQMGLRLMQTESMPEPDLFWVRAGHLDRPTTAVVPLIIEVSISSAEHDRQTKSRLYALDALQEYWIVDGDKECIEVRTKPVGAQFSQIQVFNPNDTLSPQCLPSAQLEIDWLFRSAGR